MNDKKNSSASTIESGALFVKYKVPAISLIVVLLLIPIGIGGYLHLKGEKEEAFGEKIYNFTKANMSALKDNELKGAEFVTNFKALMEETEYFRGNLPLLITATDQLVKLNNFAAAKDLLELADQKFAGKNEYTNFLIDVRLSSIYEDLGELDKAIAILEGLLSSGEKILEGKNQLDLGRFYLKQGNKEKAKEKFLLVLNNFDEENYKKLARLYMSKL
ncbi:MAG: tetratricopeptide repeat protein [Deltaproteobacteria bacterium]|nr:MAG: tetratricopeptide repeat protein [Deltaproteobacteria bacterium]